MLGLDSAASDLVFDRFADELPNLNGLARRGAYGTLRSCDPPITVPAWMVMMTGKSAGTLGQYGFRYREGNSYDRVGLATSETMTEPTVWDILGDRGDHVTVIGVPPSFPPLPVNGERIGCFLTPDRSTDFTYPKSLKEEIEAATGEYKFDISFRHDRRDEVLRDLRELTRHRFDVFEYMIKSRDWDFFIGHEIGLDRLQHTFWKYFDPEHHLYEPDSPYAEAILDHYRMIDDRVGRLISLLDDSTAIIVVSDHGAMRMKGAFCVNQWLEEQGLLTFRTRPGPGDQIEKADIDWPRTKAWAWGGYYARVFVNVVGREEQGCVPADELDGFLSEVSESLLGIRGPDGEPWKTEVFRPAERYGEARGDPPDLMVYFDDLYWRAAGTLGHESNYLLENDTGPDDAVHSMDGIIIMANCGIRGKIEGAGIADVAPTLLTLAGVSPAADLIGKSLI